MIARWTLVLAVLISACAPTSGIPSVVDGFRLGSMLKCSPPITAQPTLVGCASHSAIARATFDARSPNHAAIVGTTTFSDRDTAEAAEPYESTTIFVYELADGTYAAVGVRCTDGDGCRGMPTPG